MAMGVLLLKRLLLKLLLKWDTILVTFDIYGCYMGRRSRKLCDQPGDLNKVGWCIFMFCYEKRRKY